MQKIRVYTTSMCPYCVSAKRLLQNLNLTFEEINLENDPALRQKLSAENNGFRTVPMIFIGAEFIGGYTELAALQQKNALLAKVNA